MNRRENLKLLFTGSIASGLLLTNCTPENTTPETPLLSGGTLGGRDPEETARDQRLLSEIFFTEEERKKLSVLVDIIMPKDAESPAATELGVVDFMEFIMKDQPSYQTPMRGGLMWLDTQSKKMFSKKFVALTPADRLKVVDLIAYPNKAKKEHSQGVSFFNLMRNLTATGFFTTEMGVKDLGYMGNTPNKWDGVPDDVLKQYNLSYNEWEKHLAK
jgi:hypothetical protein